MRLKKGQVGIRNKCWHPVTALFPDGEFYHWDKESKSRSTRVLYKKKDIEPGFYIEVPDSIENLPLKRKGIRYIVSDKVLRAVKELHPGRTDLIAPGDQKPDATGKVNYCEGFKV